MKVKFIVLLLLIFANMGFAEESANPFPRPGENIQPVPNSIQSEEQKTTTENSPTPTEPSTGLINQGKTPGTTQIKPNPSNQPSQSSSNDWIVWFTGALVIVGAIQIIVYVMQARYMRQGLAIAQQTAEAALEAAKVTITAQRAYISISPLPPGLDLDPDTNFIGLSLKIENFGETPAEITDIVVHCVELLPETPNEVEPEIRVSSQAFLVKREYFFDRRVWRFNGVGDIFSGKVECFIYGHVDYIDRFRQRHRADSLESMIKQLIIKTTRTYDELKERNNLFLVFKPGFNYDRLRKPGEGNDWEKEFTPH